MGIQTHRAIGRLPRRSSGDSLSAVLPECVRSGSCFLPALVLVYVLVAEAGLQIAAFFVRRATRAEMPVAWVTGNVRVLCLGDSHTYGLWVDRSQAYPQQLEGPVDSAPARPSSRC